MKHIGILGGVYTDSLKRCNTHLICKVRSGAKFERAVEWGLRVVNLQWLFHMAEFGYVNGAECEYWMEESSAADDDDRAAAAAVAGTLSDGGVPPRRCPVQRKGA